MKNWISVSDINNSISDNLIKFSDTSNFWYQWFELLISITQLMIPEIE